MGNFLVSEMFRLDLRWADTIYEQPGVCRLMGATFSGPVIKIAQKIENNDHMFLDFYSQYLELVQGIYVGKFSWGEVSYSEDGSIVKLKDAKLTHEAELDNVPTLKDNDYFVVDTSNHTLETHANNLVYKTYLINEDNSLYRFEK